MTRCFSCVQSRFEVSCCSLSKMLVSSVYVGCGVFDRHGYTNETILKNITGLDVALVFVQIVLYRYIAFWMFYRRYQTLHWNLVIQRIFSTYFLPPDGRATYVLYIFLHDDARTPETTSYCSLHTREAIICFPDGKLPPSLSCCHVPVCTVPGMAGTHLHWSWQYGRNYIRD